MKPALIAVALIFALGAGLDYLSSISGTAPCSQWDKLHGECE